MKNNSFWENKKILVTGGGGFVGRHVIENLINNRGVDVRNIKIPSSKLHDFRDLSQVLEAIKGVDIVIHLAADIGGVMYIKNNPATQFRNCMLIDLNVFEAASKLGVEKLITLSSAVAYPENVASPLRETDLHNGFPSSSAYGYGFAKRMTTVLSKAYLQEKGLNSSVLISANSYGPGDNFDLETSNVIPALIRKCFTQKEIVVWGNGKQKRDFYYIVDMVEAIILSVEKLDPGTVINVGSGNAYSISQILGIIVRLTGFSGKITYDTSKPIGQEKRYLDITLSKKLLHFSTKVSLEEGIKKTVEWYQKNSKF